MAVGDVPKPVTPSGQETPPEPPPEGGDGGKQAALDADAAAAQDQAAGATERAAALGGEVGKMFEAALMNASDAWNQLIMESGMMGIETSTAAGEDGLNSTTADRQATTAKQAATAQAHDADVQQQSTSLFESTRDTVRSALAGFANLVGGTIRMPARQGVRPQVQPQLAQGQAQGQGRTTGQQGRSGALPQGAQGTAPQPKIPMQPPGGRMQARGGTQRGDQPLAQTGEGTGLPEGQEALLPDQATIEDAGEAAAALHAGREGEEASGAKRKRRAGAVEGTEAEPEGGEEEGQGGGEEHGTPRTRVATRDVPQTIPRPTIPSLRFASGTVGRRGDDAEGGGRDVGDGPVTAMGTGSVMVFSGGGVGEAHDAGVAARAKTGAIVAGGGARLRGGGIIRLALPGEGNPQDPTELTTYETGGRLTGSRTRSGARVGRPTTIVEGQQFAITSPDGRSTRIFRYDQLQNMFTESEGQPVTIALGGGRTVVMEQNEFVGFRESVGMSRMMMARRSSIDPNASPGYYHSGQIIR